MQPQLRVVIVSTLAHEAIVRCADVAGADRILVPPLSFRQCLCTLRLIASRLRGQADRPLGSDEQQVVNCFADGLTDKEITSRLGVTSAHLRKIEARIRRHLRARNRAEAVSHWLLSFD